MTDKYIHLSVMDAQVCHLYEATPRDLIRTLNFHHYRLPTRLVYKKLGKNYFIYDLAYQLEDDECELI